MAILKPFKGLRPPKELVQDLACLPYDVMNTEEAKKMAEGKVIYPDRFTELLAKGHQLLFFAKKESDKKLGFKYATSSGISVAMSDIAVPREKAKLLEAAEEKSNIIENQFNRGLITEDERYNGVVEVWMDTTDKITEAISTGLDRNGSIYMMATSGAKGNISQIRQMFYSHLISIRRVIEERDDINDLLIRQV